MKYAGFRFLPELIITGRHTFSPMRSILKTNSTLFRALFHFLDLAVVAGGTVLLYLVFGESGFGPYELVKALAIYGPVFTLIVFPMFGMYRSWRGESLSGELKRLFWAWGAVLLLFNAFILLLASQEQLSTLWPYGLFRLNVFWVWAAGCYAAIAAARVGGRLGFRLLRKLGYNRRSAVIVGAGEVGLSLASHLERHPWMGIHVDGFFDDHLRKGEIIRKGLSQATEVLGAVAECVEHALKVKPDMVIIALPLREEQQINRLLWDLGTKGVSVFMVPDLLVYGLQKARLQQLGDFPIMEFNLFPIWKRLFDILFSALVLVTSTPLFLFISLLIKSQDGGPVFYRHKRIGESGRPFGCLKFRTMDVDAEQRLLVLLARDPKLREEWERTYKLKNDPRVTPIGRFLRKVSLDELPQFINVLLGEMSVVGARPIVSHELSVYYKEVAMTYCAMKPGITGAWQVGKRSDTEDYKERVDLDRWYVLNSSIGLDLLIIAKTVLRMVNGKGAY